MRTFGDFKKFQYMTQEEADNIYDSDKKRRRMDQLNQARAPASRRNVQ